MTDNNKVTNIFLSGVSGQGTILASNIFAEVFLKAGYDVKKAKVHGMAQRGGDVTTHFRFGKKVSLLLSNTAMSITSSPSNSLKPCDTSTGKT
jgi:Pyruvate/2-oxoacid:ferredoxin oxidoreductase gamma subunit